MTREGSIVVLRYFLGLVSKDELIETIISTILSFCDLDEHPDEKLAEITHDIVTSIQAREIIAGRSKLEGYVEPHRSELENKIKELKSR